MLYYVAGFAANNVNVVFGEGKGNIAVASAWNSHLDKVVLKRGLKRAMF